MEIDNKNLTEFENKFTSSIRDLKETKFRHDITIKLNIIVNPSFFGAKFRQKFIKYLRTNYESRAFHLYYLEKIDFEPVLNEELPLIPLIGDEFIIPIPLQLTLLCFKKDDIIQGNLFIEEKTPGNIEICVRNNYLSCFIKPNNSQIIKKSKDNVYTINDKTYNKIYKKGDSTEVRIIDFHSNKLQSNFTPYVNCSGIIVNI